MVPYQCGFVGAPIMESKLVDGVHQKVKKWLDDNPEPSETEVREVAQKMKARRRQREAARRQQEEQDAGIDVNQGGKDGDVDMADVDVVEVVEIREQEESEEEEEEEEERLVDNSKKY